MRLRAGQGQVGFRPCGIVSASTLLPSWEKVTVEKGQPLHRWSSGCEEFADFLSEKGSHLWRLSKTLELKVHGYCRNLMGFCFFSDRHMLTWTREVMVLCEFLLHLAIM